MWYHVELQVWTACMNLIDESQPWSNDVEHLLRREPFREDNPMGVHQKVDCLLAFHSKTAFLWVFHQVYKTSKMSGQISRKKKLNQPVALILCRLNLVIRIGHSWCISTSPQLFGIGQVSWVIRCDNATSTIPLDQLAFVALPWTQTFHPSLEKECVTVNVMLSRQVQPCTDSW